MTDTLHIVFAMVTVLVMIVAIAFGASALGRRFRRYSIATIVLLLAFGALSGLDGPKATANLPTSLIGVWERIDIAVFLLLVVVLATTQLGKEKRRSSADGSVGMRVSKASKPCGVGDISLHKMSHLSAFSGT